MFRKYNSIELALREKALVAVTGIDPEWVVTEKAHGANFSFNVSSEYSLEKTCVLPGKRTSLLSPGELASFYNAAEVVDKYESKAAAVGEMVETCIIYGELIGGQYGGLPKPTPATRLVQQGVHYCPGNEFYGFDIFVKETESYLPHDRVVEVLQGVGIPVAPVLFRGSLAECLAWSAEHREDPTGIPALFGLEPLEEPNKREGHVLKPASFGGFLNNGSRPSLKDKGRGFSESRPRGGTVVLAHLEDTLKDVERFVTDHRIETLLSKEGPDTPFGKLLGLYAQDVVIDWQKETDVPLSKKELGIVKKHIVNVCRPLLLAKY